MSWNAIWRYSGKTSSSHVLEHPDACHLVKHAVDREIPVVRDLDAAAVGESFVGDALTCVRCLRLAERDPECLDTVMPNGMPYEPTPPAADVQQALPGRQTQLSANEIQLGALRGIDVLGPGEEIATGVDLLGVEPERVELVPHVVVVANRRLISLSGVAVFGTVAGGAAPSRHVALRRCRWQTQQLDHEPE